MARCLFGHGFFETSEGVDVWRRVVALGCLAPGDLAALSLACKEAYAIAHSSVVGECVKAVAHAKLRRASSAGTGWARGANTALFEEVYSSDEDDEDDEDKGSAARPDTWLPCATSRACVRAWPSLHFGCRVPSLATFHAMDHESANVLLSVDQGCFAVSTGMAPSPSSVPWGVGGMHGHRWAAARWVWV